MNAKGWYSTKTLISTRTGNTTAKVAHGPNRFVDSQPDDADDAIGSSSPDMQSDDNVPFLLVPPRKRPFPRSPTEPTSPRKRTHANRHITDSDDSSAEIRPCVSREREPPLVPAAESRHDKLLSHQPNARGNGAVTRGDKDSVKRARKGGQDDEKDALRARQKRQTQAGQDEGRRKCVDGVRCDDQSDSPFDDDDDARDDDDDDNDDKYDSDDGRGGNRNNSNDDNDDDDDEINNGHSEPDGGEDSDGLCQQDSDEMIEGAVPEPTTADWKQSPAAATAMCLRAEERRLQMLCKVHEAVLRQTRAALEGVRFAIRRLDRMHAYGA